MSCSIQVGDAIEIVMSLVDCNTNAPLDLSSAITKVINLKGPSSNLSESASFVTDGTDGKLRIVLSTGQLVPAGEWQIQAVVTFPLNSVHHSMVKRFSVINNIF